MLEYLPREKLHKCFLGFVQICLLVNNGFELRLLCVLSELSEDHVIFLVLIMIIWDLDKLNLNNILISDSSQLFLFDSAAYVKVIPASN